MTRLSIVLLCLVLLTTFFVYAQVRGHDFVNYDDPDYVTENPHVRAGLTTDGFTWAFTSASAANWIPLTWLSHMLDCSFWGLDSGWHHLTNLLFHLLTTLLVFITLRRMTRTDWPSAIVAFLFALHPLHVESVAWIAERKDVLSAFFWFLTIWCYLRYVDRPKLTRYLLVLAVFCLGLMAKQMLVTLPFVLLLLDLWPLRRKAIREKLPLFVISAVASVAAYFVQQRGGAVIPLDAVPFLIRLENAVITYWIYIAQTFWPTRLAVFYPYPRETSPFLAIAAALAIIAVSAVAIRYRSTRPYLAVGWFWYLGTLVPVIGLVQIGEQSHADRYTYIPSIGIYILLVWGFLDIVARWPRTKPYIRAISVTAYGACVILTWIQIGYWTNSETLFNHAIQATNNNYVAYTNLGVTLQKQGKLDDAASNYERALTSKPHFIEAENDLGQARLLQGRTTEAIAHFEAAIHLKPDFADAHLNLGDALDKQGKFSDSAAQYRATLQIQPDNVIAHAGLGTALAEQGQTAEAISELNEAIRLNPDYAAARSDLGLLLANLGRTPEAIIQFSAAVRLDPNNPAAHYNLGTALGAQGRINEAIDQFQAAIHLRPGNAPAHMNLGKAFATIGQYDDAIAQFTEALRLDPTLTEARENIEAVRSLQRPPSKHLQ